MQSDKGTLYLIPIPIAENGIHTLPQDVIGRIHALKHFIAENARTARRFISSTNPPYQLPDVTVEQYGKHDDISPEELLRPLLDGIDIGVMSEAGCPGIADPGATLAAWCHKNDIRVMPMVGPSSLLLALMASGLNGQKFTFHGYLPRQKKELIRSLKDIERISSREGSAHLFIEAPYRNDAMVETLLDSLNPGTRLTIAADVTGDKEFVKTLTIRDWGKANNQSFHKIPTVFIVQA